MKIKSSKILFDQIDILFDLPQNIQSYPKVIKLCRDVVYDLSAYHIAKLDVYCHKDNVDKELPVIINFHGGGFVSGDKVHRRSYASYLANIGYKVINVNYGLCPEYRFPTFIHHASNAIGWMKANSELYKFDLNKVFVSGDSAGAYIALALAVCSYDENYRNSIECPHYGIDIQGTCLFCGAYMPSQAIDKKMIFDINKTLCCIVTGLSENELDKYPSYKYYHELDAGKYITEKFPPTFISHSLKDIFCDGHAPLIIDLFNQHSIPYREICSLKNMHDWQEMQLTKSSKIVLSNLKTYLSDVVNDTISTENNTKITINNGKIVANG